MSFVRRARTGEAGQLVDGVEPCVGELVGAELDGGGLVPELLGLAAFRRPCLADVATMDA